MKHPIRTVKWYWRYKKSLFIELSHVWEMPCGNSQSYLECVETNKKIFYKTIIQKSYRIKNQGVKEFDTFLTAENFFILFVTETSLLLLYIYILLFLCYIICKNKAFRYWKNNIKNKNFKEDTSVPNWEAQNMKMNCFSENLSYEVLTLHWYPLLLIQLLHEITLKL